MLSRLLAFYPISCGYSTASDNNKHAEEDPGKPKPNPEARQSGTNGRIQRDASLLGTDFSHTANENNGDQGELGALHAERIRELDKVEPTEGLRRMPLYWELQAEETGGQLMPSLPLTWERTPQLTRTWVTQATSSFEPHDRQTWCIVLLHLPHPISPHLLQQTAGQMMPASL